MRIEIIQERMAPETILIIGMQNSPSGGHLYAGAVSKEDLNTAHFYEVCT